MGKDQGALSILQKSDTCVVSDALGSIDIKGVVRGLRPLWGSPKLVGRAVTVHIGRAGLYGSGDKENFEVMFSAIEAGRDGGSVIVIEDQTGDDAASWGGLLSLAALNAQIAGVVLDGNCRDADDIAALQFPVYAKGTIPLSARQRVAHVSTNVEVEVGGMQVRQDDVVLADGSGVVVIPRDRLEEVASIVERLLVREAASVEALRRGEPPGKVLLASTKRGA